MEKRRLKRDRPETGYAQSVTRDGSWNSVIVHLSKFEPYPHNTQVDFIIDFHINDLLQWNKGLKCIFNKIPSIKSKNRYCFTREIPFPLSLSLSRHVHYIIIFILAAPCKLFDSRGVINIPRADLSFDVLPRPREITPKRGPSVDINLGSHYEYVYIMHLALLSILIYS